MNYKKEIEDAVTKIELETGMNRGEIALKMNYAASYISTVLNRGGNKKFLSELKAQFPNILNKEQLKKPDQYDQALLNTLLNDYIKLKANITKRPAEEIAKEILENTRLLLLEMNARK